MRSHPFDEPRLFTVHQPERLLSGLALLELLRAVLDRGRPFRFRARGWSMAPFVRDGDVITITPLQGALPGVGEVVAFVRPGSEKLVVHRMVGRRKAAFLIQGDQITTQPDGMIPPQNLLGRVTRIERNGKNVWLGLGPERFLIAWLSRLKTFIPLRLRQGFCQKRFS